MHSINEIYVRNPSSLRCKGRVPAKLKTSPLPVLPSCKPVTGLTLLQASFVGVDWGIWLEQKGQPISFWHGAPLWPKESNKQIINFVVEIPIWQDAKIIIKRTEPLTWQDVQKYRLGTAQAFRDWFTYYKVARGGSVIPIIGESYQNVTMMQDVLEKSHKSTTNGTTSTTSWS
ncbi:hypothetical protein GGTG_12488 [Gaeumannomyces tritici R3-111a-1]|uniref:Inorganic diphosphatase n=1 Tax=Gaeumannomyces tritici (strain R3-111a-1) TaxID=644352 RepID=J3PG62_GAET3|nr:hypothetical protein GGTG_12488 [Gaeumannomyces tritici R3-111a-1]EJT70316.1 hypothetical protein GGTG_12488 [Gaeumannomyces tritici R3-111a-1]